MTGMAVTEKADYGKIQMRKQPWYKVESLPNLQEKGGGAMDTYEVLSLLFLGGSFLIALLAYIDRNNKRK